MNRYRNSSFQGRCIADRPCFLSYVCLVSLVPIRQNGVSLVPFRFVLLGLCRRFVFNVSVVPFHLFRLANRCRFNVAFALSSNRRVVAVSVDPNSTAASEVMTPNPTTVLSEDSAMEALSIMLGRHFRHLPVRERWRGIDEEGLRWVQ